MMVHWTEFKGESLIVKSARKGYDTINYYEPFFADTETSKLTKIVNVGTQKKPKMVEQVVDTWVYVWAMSVGETVYYGRNLGEFFLFLTKLMNFYKVDNNNQLIIYFHNLAYDISYMWSLIRDNLGDNLDSLFITKQHPIQISDNGVNFRCSYKMINKSLDKWCKDLNIEHKKLTGTKDYNVVYYPDTELPDNEYKYLEHDILGLKECFYKELEIRGYNFTNVPLTITGFVRKEFQKAFNKKEDRFRNKKYFEEAKLTKPQYDRLVRASKGGITEGNFRKQGITIRNEDGIGHCDFDSHYPTQQVCRLMPHKPTTVYDETVNADNRPTIKTLKYYLQHNKLFVVDITLKNVRLKNNVTMPFMQKSELSFSDIETMKNTLDYNGKIIEVKGYCRLCCTNLDLSIYLKQYDIEGYHIHALDTYTKSELPPYMLSTIKYFYKEKTRLKELENHLIDIGASKEEIENVHMNLVLVKGMLNSIFGCTYTRIERENIELNLDSFNYSISVGDTLEDYYSKEGSCMCYQHGCFTTAYARAELFKVISEVVGYDESLYSDTDSVFFIPTTENLKRIDEYNNECRRISEVKGFYVDYESYDGTTKRKYFHKFDFEKDHCKSKTFRFLHAKCYALEPNGELSCTIAGVPEKATKNGITKTREEELGSIENLKNGFEFTHCGGTRANYDTIRNFEGFSGGGCAILETTKKLTDDLFTDIVLEETEEF